MAQDGTWEYTILQSEAASSIEGFVTDAMNHGWKVHGPLMFINGQFCQPMIRYTEERGHSHKAAESYQTARDVEAFG